MKKPRSLAAIAALCLASSLWAEGSALDPADGLENWKYSLDLGGYKSGKYNLVVEGVDKAGNVTRAAPMNIYVDPKSDLPIVSIINPTPLMRVGGDLNIVGTAADDDGVARVELSLDGADYVPAEGGEFWSLYLKTSSMPEGRRTVDVRAVDLNGLTGPSVRVQFDLDLTKPLATVDSPVVGTLVSGQIVISGTVFDANGLRSLEISRDEGKSWEKIKLKKGKDPTRPGFAWPVDTRKLGDGPKVFKLRSVDGVGSTSTAAYLVFVDNTKPAIEVARPEKDRPVNGLFTVVGAVRDAVGVKRLSYEFGPGEKGEIPLTKGDPYFSKEFDAGKVKGDSAVVTLVAEDTIGNVVKLAASFRIDRKADKPVLKVLGPLAAPSSDEKAKAAAAAVLREGEAVWGGISDDDGVSAVRWSLDGAAPVELPCSETFSLVPPSAPPGRHLLSLVPVDSNGLSGDPTLFPYVLDKGPGSIKFDRITSAKGSRDFAQGAQASVDGGEWLEGSVSAPNPPASAEFAIAGAPYKPIVIAKDDKSGAWRFRVAIDRGFPYGFAPVSVKVKDSAGNDFEGRALTYVTDYGIAREETGFRFSDPRVGEDGRVAFGRGPDGTAKPLLGAFYGGELQTLRLDPPCPLVEASYEGRVVAIKAVKEGTSAPTRVVGKTARGHEFSAGPFVFATDSTPPELKIESPDEGAWFGGKTIVSGKAGDSGGLVALEWRLLPDGQRSKAALAADGSFKIALSAADMPAGPFSLELEAKDAAGNSSRAYRSLGASAAPPALKFLSPEPGASVWGPEAVVAFVDDPSGIASVQYAADGASFAAIAWQGRYFAHRADLAANPKAAYRVVDRAGNSVTARPDVAIVPAPARLPSTLSQSVEPAAGEAKVELSGAAGSLKVSSSLPGLPEAAYAALGDASAPAPERFAQRLLVQGALLLKGQATVEGLAKAISLSSDGGASYRLLASFKDEKSAKAVLPFSLAVEAAKLAQGPARWTIKVEDFGGGAWFCPLYLLVDAKAPSLSLVYPEPGATSMPGPYPLVLKAEDDNGLDSFELAVGGGAKASKEALMSAPSDSSGAGGRYFAVMVDPASGEKAAPPSLAATARDAAGNQAGLAPKISYDAAGDSPKPRLDSLVAEVGGLVLGSASDDDGPASIKASIDGNDVGVFPAGSFAFALPSLAAGKHSLAIEAAAGGDASTGQAAAASTVIKKDFSVAGTPPALGDFVIGDGKSSSPWSPGADFALVAGSVLTGSVSAANAPVAIAVSFNGGAPIQAMIGKAATGAAAGSALPFSAAIPLGTPYDRLRIELRAKDAQGLESLERLELHKILPPASGSDDTEGIRFADERIRESEGKKSLLLAPGDSIKGMFNGRAIKAVSLKPVTPFLEASFNGSSVAIAAKAEGLVAERELLVETIDGDTFSWGPFSAAIDAASPSLDLSFPADGDWVRGELRVAGKASDAVGLASIELGINGGEPQKLFEAPAAAKAGSAPAATGEASFDKAVSLAAVPDGSVRLDFVARDTSGRVTRASRFINKDTLPPELTQVLPAPGESVNGLTTFVGEASDAGRLASVAFLQAAGAEPEAVSGLSSFSRDLDLARLAMPLHEGGGFVVVDMAGNKAVLAPTLVVDKEKDKPIVEIHSPSDMEVLRGDFVISGVAYDDDGLAAAYYRIDGGAWTRLEMSGTSFSVSVALKDTSDNEHLVEAKAEDIYGVQGDVASRKYRISKEEPVALMTAPAISKPVRGKVTLAGSSADANGVKEVSVSVDNRASYDRPLGAEAWKLGLDTSTLSDGIHAVAVRPIDGYDTEGFYASMISVDNTPPKAQMDLPLDGQEVSGMLSVSGRVSDNLAIASARIEVAPVGASTPPILVVELGSEKIVQRDIDLSALKQGLYTVRLVVRDRADNESLASRDVALVGALPADSVSIVFPVEGESASGTLRVQGRAIVASGALTTSVLVDGNVVGAAEPDALGWFSLDVPKDNLSEGDHLLKARTSSSEGKVIESPETRVKWSALGPWASIDSFATGKYLPYRPYLKGKAGWLAEDAPAAPAKGDKDALAAYKLALAAYQKAQAGRVVVGVDVSLDDGRTYSEASGTRAWSFRLETQDYKEGALHAIVRARYADGSTAVSKGLYFLDKTLPEIQVLSPTEGGRLNGRIELSGRSFDQNGMATVGVALRKGDKANYEVPSFIQGLYLDGQMLGATTWEAGLGLTFFGDNVKLEGIYGSAPVTDENGDAQSFYGDVFGAKLIANLLYLPFDSIFGPDWSFLSTSLGVGANFTYFTKTQSGSGLIVGSVFGQVEFPKLTLRDWKAFKKFSLYAEYQLWVLSSVVDGGFIPKASFGARIGVF